MSRLDNIDQFNVLPLFGQALIAVRMVRRAALAKLPAGDEELALITRTCDAAEECARTGQGTHRCRPLFKEAMALRDQGGEHHRQREWLRTALWWMVDSVNAAEAANDFPIDATVTRSAKNAIASLGQDKNFSQLQLTILLAGDVDQMMFACTEIGRGPDNLGAKYSGLGDHVMGRLAPVHALSLVEAPPERLER